MCFLLSSQYSSYCHPEGRNRVRGRLTFTEDEQPLVAHIWGNQPEYFKEMSIGMAEAGFSGIDINMGCPSSECSWQRKRLWSYSLS